MIMSIFHKVSYSTHKNLSWKELSNTAMTLKFEGNQNGVKLNASYHIFAESGIASTISKQIPKSQKALCV